LIRALSADGALAEPFETFASDGHAAVIDIGSNSVRLVIYAGLTRTPLPVFNEKVLCGLGAEIEATGRLSASGRALALTTLARFAGLLRRMKLDQLDVVATAAVRDAKDGQEFLAELRDQLGMNVRVLSGRDEARMAALGVLSGMPEAEGLIGDLGGGSLELVKVANGEIGQGVTLPLGVLRMQKAKSKGNSRQQKVKAALKSIDWLPEVKGQTLYVVGGAWRALGRVHLARQKNPLRILHGHVATRSDLASVCQLIAGLGPETLRNIEGAPKGRVETLPAAAVTMLALLRQCQPKRVVFSAYGLREGLLFDRLDAAARRLDPLIAAGQVLARLSPRFPLHEQELLDWLSPLFPEESQEDRRLRLAASVMSDMGWRAHPDYRADHAMDEILHAPLVGVDHRQRVKLALSVRARYSHKGMAAAAEPYRSLVKDGDLRWAQQVGCGLRLAHLLSAGVPSVLRRFDLERRADRVILRSHAGAPEPPEEAISARLKQLSDAIDKPVLYLPAS